MSSKKKTRVGHSGASKSTGKDLCYLIQYTMDGIYAIKKEDDLEHEEVMERSELWIQDAVLCEWDDGEKYSAKILAIGPKATVQVKLKELKSGTKNNSAHVKNFEQARKKRQALHLQESIEKMSSSTTSTSRICLQDDQTDIPSSSFSNDDKELLKNKLKRNQTKTWSIDSDEDEPASSKMPKLMYYDDHHPDVLDSWNNEENKWKKMYEQLKFEIETSEKPKVNENHTTKETKKLKYETEVQPSQSPKEHKIDTEKPKPGKIDPAIAKKSMMKELFPGSGVYWTQSNEQIAKRKSSTFTQLTYSLIETFFHPSILAISNAKGGGKSNNKALDTTITDAIKAYVMREYPSATESGINVAINNKCTSARRSAKMRESLET